MVVQMIILVYAQIIRIQNMIQRTNMLLLLMNSSSASPEVADKKGIRACTMDEPNHNDEINTGFMKLFTGGDEITARALFQEPIYFKPQFKPFLLCNKLPNIRSDDDGTWRRLK